jgi:hypothetical protein
VFGINPAMDSPYSNPNASLLSSGRKSAFAEKTSRSPRIVDKSIVFII